MAIEAQLYSENLGFALGGTQDLLMENACGFNGLCFVPQQQQLSVQLGQTLDFSGSLSAQIEKQRMEIDGFISLRNERLRLALQEQRKRQNALFLKIYESKTLHLLKQREEQISKAKNRSVELQHFLQRMEIENQAWRRLTKENEAKVASLNSTIQRLKEAVNLSSNAAEDAESCCQIMEEKRTYNRDHFNSKIICRSCNNRNSCVILLPCRHLCSCRDCEAFLDSCPVCGMVKKACIEAMI
ncbi:probable BOI-related E3 ubiquitin-protein ligase 3 [Primulina eburnea]|uniref:probable BOI-related E3 ubiquitin-protein ligase 3 n=1 Tax=Primulina eburnea TaxID=1245227 RepID=UPI003C6BFF5F